MAGACGGDDKATETVTVAETATVTVTETAPAATTTTPTSGSWTGLPEPPPADGTLPVDEFNAYAESVDEPWERDVALVTEEYVRPDETEVANRSYQGSVNNDTATTSLAPRRAVRRLGPGTPLRPDAEPATGRTWRVDSARWAQRCQRGRGHQDFTAEPCI